MTEPTEAEVDTLAALLGREADAWGGYTSRLTAIARYVLTHYVSRTAIPDGQWCDDKHECVSFRLHTDCPVCAERRKHERPATCPHGHDGHDSRCPWCHKPKVVPEPTWDDKLRDLVAARQYAQIALDPAWRFKPAHEIYALAEDFARTFMAERKRGAK